MNMDVQVTQPSLYDRDFAAWLVTTAMQLRERDYENLDWDNLIEEIEAMGRRERKSLTSNLVIVLLHLLKWQYQPEMRSGSWKGSIREHRRRIHRDLRDSPSLQPYLLETFAEAYTNAFPQAADETGLSIETFPVDCPYTIEQVLDSEFLPD
jgi:hypothetical protein